MKRREYNAKKMRCYGHTYFVIIPWSGAITSFSRIMAWTSTLGKDCSSRQEPYMTTFAMPRRLSVSSTATCSTAPLGKPIFKAMAYDNQNCTKQLDAIQMVYGI
jgi:hypothetical protein